MDQSNEKVIVITGASTGIGAATARMAAEQRYRIVLAARSTSKLKTLAKELGGSDRILPVTCDVSDWDSQQSLLRKTLEAFGRIDVVFANAGLTKGAPILGGDDTPQEWREMILTNIYGVAVTARLFLPELIKTKGHLILTSSVLGRFTRPGNLYSATKWAVTGMGEAIRQQLVSTGARLTIVEPGKVDTPFWTEKPNDPLLMAEDVARAVMFAVSQPEHVSVNEVLIRPTGQVL